MIKAQVDLHIERKLTHIFGVLAMVLVHHFCPLYVTWIIIGVFALPLVIFDFLRQKNEKLKVLTPKLFGGIMRRRELHGLAGTTYLLTGAAIIFLLFPHDIVALSLLFLALADPLASFAGIKFGTIRILGKKTLEGFLMAFCVCTITAAIFYYNKRLMIDHLVVVSILSGFIGAFAELLPVGNLDDNLTQPILNAVFLSGLFFLFGGFA
jgi:diacylglycerol kinase (CTP)